MRHLAFLPFVALTTLSHLVLRTSAEFNFEIALRVHDRLADFMGGPAKVLDSVSNLISNDYFPHGLRAPDRNLFLKYGDAMMKSYQYNMIYYGSEDGTFIGNFYPERMATYREPGESGYVTSDLTTDRNKHYMSCVGGDAEEIPCLLSAGDSYIECVGECSLIKCTETDSQEDGNTKWCRDYVEKQIPEGSGHVERGYIPRSDYCIDEKGLPTQSPGTVIEHLNAEPTNCYFKDGVTAVNRKIVGDYAFCGGDGQLCNTTFSGAYNSINYDPRSTGWYKNTRALQKPNWSPPYTFFTTMEMGVTYTHPIYRYENNMEVFSGVLGLDLHFSDIASFLVQNYEGTGTIVTIIEKAEPNYVISSCTGSSVLREVLVEDERRPCPPNFEQDQCKSARITIPEFSQVPNDVAVAAAFSRHEESGYNEDKLVPMEVGDKTYITQIKSFVSESTGIDWWIVVMAPLEARSEDTVEISDTMFAFIVAPSIAGFISCATIFAVFVKNRNEREVMYSDWRFTGAFIMGCAFLNLVCLSFIGENSDEMCLTRMWLLHLFFVLALAPLLVKTYRMYLLVGKASLRRRGISHTKTAMMMLLFVVVQVAILTLFTFVDPSKETVIIIEEEYEVIHRRVCDHETKAFFAVQVTYVGGLILAGCYLAHKTQHMEERFGEAKQLLVSMYNIAFVATILVLAANLSEVYESGVRALVTIGICWMTCFSSVVFVIPRLLRVRSGKHSKKDRVVVSGLSNAQETHAATSVSKATSM